MRASSRRFVRVLLMITLVGLAVRVGYVAFVEWDEPLLGDQVQYQAVANRLAQGHGFVEPYDKGLHVDRVGAGPSAEHPPLTALVLTPVSWVLNQITDSDTTRGDTHGPAHRLTLAIVGSLSVLLVGLLGRLVAGDRVGLVAAGLTAVYPNLWVNDGLVMSETLTVLTVVGVLILAYRYARTPTFAAGLAMGAACGLAALARAEMVLLVPFLVVPATLAIRSESWRTRLQRAAAAVLAALVIMGPWVVFNLVRFEDPTFLSTNDGQTLLGANCDGMYNGSAVGLWQLSCLPLDVPGDRSQVSSEYRRLALDYVRSHSGRAPIVALARLGRLWSVYRPGQMVWYNAGEGRSRWVSRAGLWFFYPIVVLALAGGVALRRRLDLLWPLLVVIGIVSLVAVLTYGQVRFRAPAEPCLVVLASVGIDVVIRKARPRPGEIDAEPVEPAGAGALTPG